MDRQRKMRDKYWRESRENIEERIQRDELERKIINIGEIREGWLKQRQR